LLGLLPLAVCRGSTLLLSVIALWIIDHSLQRHAGGGRRKWVLTALIIANPFTLNVVHMGQTSLLVLAGLLVAVDAAQRRRDVLAGMALAVATLKPQFAIFLLVWFALGGRWRIVASCAAVLVAAIALPMVLTGDTAVLADWASALLRYRDDPINDVGAINVFGMANFLHEFGLVLPHGELWAAALAGGLWLVRKNYDDDVLLGLLSATSALLLYAHDYDLVVLLPLLPSLWRWQARQPERTWAGTAGLALLFVPQRLVRGFGSHALEQFRVPVVVALIAWWVLAMPRTSLPRSPRAFDR
jgi:hypothetical protein